jgi:hypothetical protein
MSQQVWHVKRPSLLKALIAKNKNAISDSPQQSHNTNFSLIAEKIPEN